MKHNRGIRNDTLTAGMPNNVLQSIMEACNGGNIEPPNIAIIRPAAPNFASSPIPFRAIPYIVGNISDIHADTPTRQYRPYIPSINITPVVKIVAATESVARSAPGLKYLRMKVHINRLMQNITIAIMLYFCERTSASISSIP